MEILVPEVEAQAQEAQALCMETLHQAPAG
jgi:hypothetical protein